MDADLDSDLFVLKRGHPPKWWDGYFFMLIHDTKSWILVLFPKSALSPVIIFAAHAPWLWEII
jgi:hypothetical protein